MGSTAKAAAKYAVRGGLDWVTRGSTASPQLLSRASCDSACTYQYFSTSDLPAGARCTCSAPPSTQHSPDSSTPATKAPRVSEKPRRWVSSEAPVTVSSTRAMNVSSLRASATSSNTLQGAEGGADRGRCRACKMANPRAGHTASAAWQAGLCAWPLAARLGCHCVQAAQLPLPSPHLRMNRRPPSSTIPRPPRVLSAVGPSCCTREIVSWPSSSAVGGGKRDTAVFQHTIKSKRGPRLRQTSPQGPPPSLAMCRCFSCTQSADIGWPAPASAPPH